MRVEGLSPNPPCSRRRDMDGRSVDRGRQWTSLKANLNPIHDLAAEARARWSSLSMFIKMHDSDLRRIQTNG